MKTIQSILYATDFSAQADAAFPLAVALARDYGAKLTIAHVVPMPAFAYTTGDLAAVPHASPEEVREMLQRFDPQDPSVHVEYESAEGDASTEILQMAKKFHCDLIIIGTHGRTGLSRLLAGSVAEEVMRHAPCPVLTVRCPAAPEYLPEEAEKANPAENLLLLS
jgi:universal stress protein A